MKETREQLDIWTNTGFNEEAVAVYGTSVEWVKRALEEGQVPWHSPYPDRKLLPYQKELLENGGHLYYGKPFVERLGIYNPKLAQEIVELTGGIQYLSEDVMLQQAKFYAIASS